MDVLASFTDEVLQEISEKHRISMTNERRQISFDRKNEEILLIGFSMRILSAIFDNDINNQYLTYFG